MPGHAIFTDKAKSDIVKMTYLNARINRHIDLVCYCAESGDKHTLILARPVVYPEIKESFEQQKEQLELDLDQVEKGRVMSNLEELASIIRYLDGDK